MKTALTEQFVLITGATQGIGYELAKVFAKNHFPIILVARNEKKLKSVQNEIATNYDVKVEYFICDISNITDIDNLVKEIQNKGLIISTLINNAGVGYWGKFEDINTNTQIEMLNLNIIGLTHLCRLIIPEMKKRKSGKVMNIASIASFTPNPYAAVYAASKSYVLSLSEALNVELDEYGIKVSALCPPDVHSGFQKEAGYPNYIPSGIFSSTAKTVATTAYKQFMKGKSVIRPWKSLAKFVFFLKGFSSRKFEINIAKNIVLSRINIED